MLVCVKKKELHAAKASKEVVVYMKYAPVL